MATNTQNSILTAFQQAAGTTEAGTNYPLGTLQPSATGGLQEALSQASQVINAQTQATGANTDALAQNTQVKGNSGGNGVQSVVNTVSQFLGGGLSLMPLVSLFTDLFGGGGEQQPAPMVPYALPPSLNLESTTNYQDVVWGDNGLPRAAAGQPPQGHGGTAGPQITVQVQAMDSQSFLDHSADIAQAVRQAMLNMNSINDVINEL